MQAWARRADALASFERRTAAPMLLLSLTIVALLVLPLMYKLSSGMQRTFTAIEWLIWAVFVAEYGIRLYLAPEKWPFVKRNKIDLVIIVLPFLRPLRVVRSARALRVLRAGRAAAFNCTSPAIGYFRRPAVRIDDVSALTWLCHVHIQVYPRDRIVLTRAVRRLP